MSFKKMMMTGETPESDYMREALQMSKYQTPVNIQRMKDLDDEMKYILQQNLDDYTKAVLYSQALRRFLAYKNQQVLDPTLSDLASVEYTISQKKSKKSVEEKSEKEETPIQVPEDKIFDEEKAIDIIDLTGDTPKKKKVKEKKVIIKKTKKKVVKPKEKPEQQKITKPVEKEIAPTKEFEVPDDYSFYSDPYVSADWEPPSFRTKTTSKYMPTTTINLMRDEPNWDRQKYT